MKKDPMQLADVEKGVGKTEKESDATAPTEKRPVKTIHLKRDFKKKESQRQKKKGARETISIY